MKTNLFYSVLILNFLYLYVESFSDFLAEAQAKNSTSIKPFPDSETSKIFQFHSSSQVLFGNDLDNQDVKKSYSKSQSYSYSNINGKVNKEIQGSEFEVIKNKDDQKKYASIYHKKNNKPLQVKTKATSTNETEALILGPDAETKNLTDEETTNFLKENGFPEENHFNVFSNFNPFNEIKDFGFESIIQDPYKNTLFEDSNDDAFEKFFKHKSESFLKRANHQQTGDN